VVEQRLPVEADHHGALGHVQQASHHVSPLPGTAQRLAPLVVPLGLEERASPSSPTHKKLTLYVHQGRVMFSYFFTAAMTSDYRVRFSCFFVVAFAADIPHRF